MSHAHRTHLLVVRLAFRWVGQGVKRVLGVFELGRGVVERRGGMQPSATDLWALGVEENVESSVAVDPLLGGRLVKFYQILIKF